MKLSEWARTQGISYPTAYRWYRDGKMPENFTTERTKTGTILVYEKNVETKVIQRDDTGSQEIILKGVCANCGCHSEFKTRIESSASGIPVEWWKESE